MKNYIEKNEWEIIEKDFHPKENRLYESVMSLGNGYMGMRGNFEEKFTGDSLRGCYVAGVYYPDKTRVGWWKNGYPEYFAKVLNATNFIGIGLSIDGEEIDLSKIEVENFTRKLDMKHGVLTRSFVILDAKGRETEISVIRFLSLVRKEIGVIAYSVKPLNQDAVVTFMPYLDGNVSNEDSNYDEKFWLEVERDAYEGGGTLTMKTKKLDFHVNCTMKYELKAGDLTVPHRGRAIEQEKYVANEVAVAARQGETTTLYKYIAVTNSRYVENNELISKAEELLGNAMDDGFDKLLKEHRSAWLAHWRESDISIEGDVSAQQAIRFNIFQLNQTYTGEDPRLNIGPKGFTGEKYGGSTYWDTEAYCIPFYLSTQDQRIARNLLIYRHNQLAKAKENAAKLGFDGAFYPMVTMNGEECHNEWEITFEEIHRNAAISYAIYNYVTYTGDETYLYEYGLDVLVGISRFWASRVNYQPKKDKYMILGVTGPNEYENNVHNNWYTNRMAVWNLNYTLTACELLKNKFPSEYDKLVVSLGLNETEFSRWRDITVKMYYPFVEEFNVFEQQDGYMDKEQILVKDLDPKNLPLNQKWSWDRILRSCFIKQADVLQGLYFLNDEYDRETKKRNFDFYEPRTVHESSLSPCIHSILAGEIGYHDKAYELYLRTARLDLDNYNNDTEDGLHITSMAGTWMSITYGFGGLRVRNGMLSLAPFIPDAWAGYSFKIMFRGHLIKVEVQKDRFFIIQEAGESFALLAYDKEYHVGRDEKVEIKL